jgi:hypothetical protein
MYPISLGASSPTRSTEAASSSSSTYIPPRVLLYYSPSPRAHASHSMQALTTARLSPRAHASHSMQALTTARLSPRAHASHSMQALTTAPSPRAHASHSMQALTTARTLSSPQVLLALAAGAAAVELEESDDETITESALEALRSMFGSSVPPPTRTVVTRWGADKFARGSYSYVHVGASGQDYATLGEPVRAYDCDRRFRARLMTSDCDRRFRARLMTSDCDRRFRARLMTSDCMRIASLIRWASGSTSRASTR